MKRCPQCARTYADETLSFCIADGQLLSASYPDAFATLPLSPARATAEPATLVIPAPLTSERARAIIRRNWIVGAVGVPVGAIIMLMTLTSDPKVQTEPIGTLIFGAAFGALIYGYMFWTSFWGFPKVWRWWRTPVTKLYQLANRMEFSAAVTVVLVLAGVCALVPGLALVFVYFYSLFWVGLFYSFFGGGIYQFLQARKIAKIQE